MRSLAIAASRDLLTIALLTALNACGGNGGAAFGGGIGGSGVISGMVTQTAPLVVDGIEFDTGGAMVSVDESPATVADLRVGMVVIVEGIFDEDAATGQATSIVFNSLVEGQVIALNDTSGTLTILGDSVAVDARTVLAGITLDQSVVGTTVRVSGFVETDGEIRATLVEAQPGSLVRALSGIITELDADVGRFRLRNLLVDYNNTVRIDAPVGGLRDGLVARVLVVQPPVGGIIDAVVIIARLTPFDPLEPRPVRVEGIVNEIAGPGEFVLNRHLHVLLGRRTEFVSGTVADLDVGARVRVTGLIRRGPSLAAMRIVFANTPPASP